MLVLAVPAAPLPKALTPPDTPNGLWCSLPTKPRGGFRVLFNTAWRQQLPLPIQGREQEGLREHRLSRGLQPAVTAVRFQLMLTLF